MNDSDLVASSRPDAVRAALAANADDIAHAGHAHGGADLSSLREATYRGRHIRVRTTYEITVDGRAFGVHLSVDNAGRVHYHGLPTRDFASVIGLVQKAIDQFPDDFPLDAAGSPDPGVGGHPHHHDGQA